VTVREIHSQRVYVIGEVRREGAIRLTGPLTVLQTLAEAGGLTDYAKRKKIYILRVQNGRQIRLPFDYDAVLRGERVEQNITLLPGDTLVVPR
jgi:polysaccharide export outer membrane protein